MPPWKPILLARILENPDGSLTRDQAVRTLIEQVADEGHLAHDAVEEVFLSFQKREALGSTGVGGGVGIPIARNPRIEHMVAVFAVIKGQPIRDYEALDDGPVDLLALMLSPPTQPGDHLRTLELISRVFKSETALRALRQSRTAEEILTIVQIVREATYP